MGQSTSIESGQDPHTKPFKIVDVNGEKGSMIGFGGTVKLMWSYYQKTQEQYDRLQEQLGNASSYENYARIFAEIWDEPRLVEEVKKALPFGLGTLSTRMLGNGLETMANTFLEMLEKEKRDYYQEPLSLEAYVDGKKVDTGKAHSIFISTFPRVKIAPLLSIYPLPEAEKDPDCFQMLFCSHTVAELFTSVLPMRFGVHLPKNDYRQVRRLDLVSKQPILAQIDGDFATLDKKVSVTMGETQRVVCLPNEGIINTFLDPFGLSF
ncbi:MAG: hypothetical protein AABX04_06580 [Nanoarchaeota archaeon]